LSLPTSNGSQFAGGDPIASALLGYPSTARRDLSPPWASGSKNTDSISRNDWKVNRRLTLNLGPTATDLYPPATEAHDRQANFDLATATMILAERTEYRNAPSGPISSTSARTLALLLLSSDGKTVVRGGYGHRLPAAAKQQRSARPRSGSARTSPSA